LSANITVQNTLIANNVKLKNNNKTLKVTGFSGKASELIFVLKKRLSPSGKPPDYSQLPQD